MQEEYAIIAWSYDSLLLNVVMPRVGWIFREVFLVSMRFFSKRGDSPKEAVAGARKQPFFYP